MNTKVKDTRQHILDVGYRLIADKGFANVGLSELLKVAGVPKGSFYHYFKSKEQFGVELINDYFSNDREMVCSILENTSNSSFDNLMDFWRMWLPEPTNESDQKRSLVVKMAAEVADHSEQMRLALYEGSKQTVQIIADCIERGITDGTVQQQDSQQTASHLYSLWLGSILVYKVHREDAIFEIALKQTQAMLLKVQS